MIPFPTSPVVGGPAIPSRDRYRVRIGEPFEPAGDLHGGLPFGPARHAIVEAALDDSVMELEEDGADEILDLRPRRGLEERAARLRLPVREEDHGVVDRTGREAAPCPRRPCPLYHSNISSSRPIRTFPLTESSGLATSAWHTCCSIQHAFHVDQ